MFNSTSTLETLTNQAKVYVRRLKESGCTNEGLIRELQSIIDNSSTTNNLQNVLNSTPERLLEKWSIELVMEFSTDVEPEL